VVENYLWLRLAPTAEWTTVRVGARDYVTAPGVTRGYVTIFFNGPGQFWLDDIRLEAEAVGAGEKITVDGKTFFFKPRNAEPDAPLTGVTPAEERRGCVLYSRPPRHVYPDSIPQPGERVTELRNFVTPGEYSVFHFAVHALRDCRITDFEVSDLESPEGSRIDQSLFQRQLVRFWIQRTGGTAPTYYVIPELIEDWTALVEEFGMGDDMFRIAAGANRLFWLQIKVPAQIPAGDYRGTLRVLLQPLGTVEFPISLRVLPFTLERPGVDWVMYTGLHILPQKRYTRPQKLRYLRDLCDYGITGVNQRVFPGRALQAQIAAFQDLRRTVGMAGAWFVNFGALIEMTLIREILGSKDFVSHPFPGTEDPRVRNAFVETLRDVDRWIRESGGDDYATWYYQGIDEPHSGSKMQQALWEYPLAKEAGARTESTVYPRESVARLGPHLDLCTNSFFRRDPAGYEELGRKFNLRYYYLGAGCYGGQEGGLMPNRRLCGFLFYPTRLPGHVFYTYQVTGDDVYASAYSDLVRKREAIAYPARKITAERVSLSTLQWEGIREGITDYRYLFTLERHIARARERGLPEPAVAAQALLEEVLDLAAAEDLDNRQATRLRSMLAGEIMRLREVLK